MLETMESTQLTQEDLNRLEDAGRGSRLIASILDSVFMTALIVPVMWFTGGFDSITTGEPYSQAYSIGIALYGYFVFAVLNGKLLLAHGQTLGKKLQRIRVVTLKDEVPRLYPHLSKRYAVFFLVGYIPFIGTFLSFINFLIIFGKSSKCGHDLFAATRVVKC